MDWLEPLPHELLWGRKRLVLTPDAARFLALLRSLGHLDGRLEEAFFDGLSPPCSSFESEPLVLDRVALRRLLAVHLFSSVEALPSDQREVLAREWTLLFG